MVGRILYNIGIRIMVILIKCHSFINSKSKLWIEGTHNSLKRLDEILVGNESKIIWFHCASVGEFEQARPIIELIKAKLHSYKILISFFSPSGFELRKNYELADYVVYLPVDTYNNSLQFVNKVKPIAAFFIKYEFWYHYITTMSSYNIPVYSVSSIFRKKQLFFKPYGGFYRNILMKFTMIFVQNSESLDLLNTINIKSEKVGDTRFDRVFSLNTRVQPLPIIKKFKTDSCLFVAGSTWHSDLPTLIPCINQFYLHKKSLGRLKTIIVPHEVGENNIHEITKALKVNYVLYSQAQNKDLTLYEVLIIDNIGMLSSIYQYAKFAYIGGGFSKGIHNILEAATYGVPVTFGPNHHKYQEALDLTAAKAANAVHNAKALMDCLITQSEQPEIYLKASEYCKSYVESHTGASEKIFNETLAALDE